MKKLMAIAAFAVVLITATTLRVSAADDIRAQIESANRKFEELYAAGDAAGVAACYTADAQVLPPGSDAVKGTEAIAGFWKSGMDNGLKGVKLTIVEVEQHGDTAIELGRAQILGSDKSVLDSIKYVVVWKRVDGMWKLHRDIWNSNVAAD
jgi:uncharacterized protein (TIGR02246 family)